MSLLARVEKLERSQESDPESRCDPAYHTRSLQALETVLPGLLKEWQEHAEPGQGEGANTSLNGRQQ